MTRPIPAPGEFQSIWVPLLLVLLLPANLESQNTSPEFTSFRNLVDVQLLAGGSGADASSQPSLRVALRRRTTLNWSAHLSGLFLQDALSHSTGVALGVERSFPVGPVLLSPFLEGGAASFDARVPSASYEVGGAGGTSTVRVYRAADGFAGLFGGGLWTTFMAPGGLSARVGLGYWRMVSSEGFDPGRIRLGAGIGVATRDEEWFALASDRTPPMVRVAGADIAVGDSVGTEDGWIEIFASDANGIETILVGTEEVTAGPVPESSRVRWALGQGAVGVRRRVAPPFEGERLPITVRDRAGVVTRAVVWAFGEPDRRGPVVIPVESDERTWTVEAVADDFAGIASASVGSCSLQLLPVGALDSDSDGLSDLARALVGWGDFPPASVVSVTDRSGNVTESRIASSFPHVRDGAAPPQLSRLTAEIHRSEQGGAGAALVRGVASDPDGGWIVHVSVNGRPVVLRALRTPEAVEFAAWHPDVSGDEVVVSVRTADGRTASQTVAVRAADGRGAVERLEIVMLGGDGPDRQDLKTELGHLESAVGHAIRVSHYEGREEAEAGLERLRNRLGERDRVWIHLAGTLLSSPPESGPRVGFQDGTDIPVSELARRFRLLPGDAVLVTTELVPGRTWRAPVARVPGARTAPGCFDQSFAEPGAVAGVLDVSMTQVLEGLSGEGDRDRDGHVTVGELIHYLGVPVGGTVLPFRPSTRITSLAERR